MHQSILVSIYLDPGLTFDILTDVFENRNMLEESKVLGLLLGIFVMSCHVMSYCAYPYAILTVFPLSSDCVYGAWW